MKPPVFNHKQYTDLEADYMILKAENEQLKAQLSTTNNRLEAAVEDIEKMMRICEKGSCRFCADGDCTDSLYCSPKWRWVQDEKGEAE